MRLTTDSALSLPTPLDWWNESHQARYGRPYGGSEVLDRRLLEQFADLHPAQLLLAIERYLSSGAAPSVASFCASMGDPDDLQALLEPRPHMAVAELVTIRDRRGHRMPARQREYVGRLERAVWDVADLEAAESDVSRAMAPAAEERLRHLLDEFERAGR